MSVIPPRNAAKMCVRPYHSEEVETGDPQKWLRDVRVTGGGVGGEGRSFESHIS